MTKKALPRISRNGMVVGQMAKARDAAARFAAMFASDQLGGQAGSNPTPRITTEKPMTYAARWSPASGSIGAMKPPKKKPSAQSASQANLRNFGRCATTATAVLRMTAASRRKRKYVQCAGARTKSNTVQARYAGMKAVAVQNTIRRLSRRSSLWNARISEARARLVASPAAGWGQGRLRSPRPEVGPRCSALASVSHLS